MLALRPNCENCNKSLDFDAKDAMICSFECTFCKECVEKELLGVCPNCGGNFSIRPIRPMGLLEKYPGSNKQVFQPVDKETHIKKWNIT